MNWRDSETNQNILQHSAVFFLLFVRGKGKVGGGGGGGGGVPGPHWLRSGGESKASNCSL